MTAHDDTDVARAVDALIRACTGPLGVVLVVVGVGLTTGSWGAAVLAAGVLLVVDRVTENVGHGSR